SLGLSRQEITDLLKGKADLAPSPSWVAFAFQIGMALELVNRNLHSKKKARSLPNWMDMSQLTYLGVVTNLVTNDVEFFETSRRVAELVSGTTRYHVEANLAPRFFSRIGFPL